MTGRNDFLCSFFFVLMHIVYMHLYRSMQCLMKFGSKKDDLSFISVTLVVSIIKKVVYWPLKFGNSSTFSQKSMNSHYTLLHVATHWTLSSKWYNSYTQYSVEESTFYNRKLYVRTIDMEKVQKFVFVLSTNACLHIDSRFIHFLRGHNCMEKTARSSITHWIFAHVYMTA